MRLIDAPASPRLGRFRLTTHIHRPTWIGLVLCALAVLACQVSTVNLFPTLTPTATTLPLSTSTLEARENVRTPIPGTVEVVLAAAPDSPFEIFFIIRNEDGKTLVEVNLYSGREQAIYLPPGRYHFYAMSPKPTQPLWCYLIAASYPYDSDGEFGVANQPVRIELKQGSLLLPCTPTPTPQ